MSIQLIAEANEAVRKADDAIEEATRALEGCPFEVRVPLGRSRMHYFAAPSQQAYICWVPFKHSSGDIRVGPNITFGDESLKYDKAENRVKAARYLPALIEAAEAKMKELA